MSRKNYLRKYDQFLAQLGYSLFVLVKYVDPGVIASVYILALHVINMAPCVFHMPSYYFVVVVIIVVFVFFLCF